jgi:hypothetical protein
MLVCSLTSVVQANPVVVGVDPPTVGRLNADDESKLLNSLHESGVRVIRTWIADDTSYDFVKKDYVLGIKAELALSLVSGLTRRSGPVSQICQTCFLDLLCLRQMRIEPSQHSRAASKLEDLGIDFVAFELGRTIRVSMERSLARITKLRLQLTNGGCPRTVDSVHAESPAC